MQFRPGIVIAFAILCGCPNVLMPLLVGSYVDWLAVPAPAAGRLASAELTGVAIGSFLTAAAFGRFSIRAIPFALGSIFVAANAATLLLGITALGEVRFVAGMGEGGSIAFMAGVLAKSDQPQRYFAIFFCLFSLSASAVFQLASLLVETVPKSAIFYLLTVLGLIGLILVALPQRSAASAGASDRRDDGRVTDDDVAQPFPIAWLAAAMAMLFVFFLGCGAIWVFAERVAVEQGYAVGAARSILSIGSLAGAAGAATAAVTGARLSPRTAIVLGFSGLLAGAVAIALRLTVVPYAVSLLIFAFGWMFTTPFVLAIVSRLDRAGKAAALGMGVQNVGQAAGPALASLLLLGGRLSGVGWMTAACLLFGLTLALILHRVSIRNSPVLDA